MFQSVAVFVRNPEAAFSAHIDASVEVDAIRTEESGPPSPKDKQIAGN